MKKKLLSLALSLSLCAGLCVPAAAAYNGPRIVQVEGGHASFAVTEDGSLWGWGCEAPKEMGFPDGGQPGRPQLLMSGVRSVAASRALCESPTSAYGKRHALILKTDGSLYGVGSNDGYALGQGRSNQTYTFTNPAFILSGVRQASTGMCMNAAVTNSGDLYIWGHYDGYIYEDDNAKLICYETPTKIASGVRQVDVGQAQVIYLTDGGDVYTFGVTELINRPLAKLSKAVKVADASD